MSSFRQHRDSPSSCLRSPRVLLLLSLLIASASTCSGRKSQGGVVNGLGEWEFGRAADDAPRRHKQVDSNLDKRKLTGERRKAQRNDMDEAPTSLNAAGTSTRPPIRALRQSRRFRLFLSSTAEGSSSSSGATAADALDRYLGSGDDIFFSHSFSHSYEDDSSEEHDSDESDESGDSGGSADISTPSITSGDAATNAADGAPEEESAVQEEEALAIAEGIPSEIARSMTCLDGTTEHTVDIEFEYEIEGDLNAAMLARDEIANSLFGALKDEFPTCKSHARGLRSVDNSINQLRRTTDTEEVEYIELTSHTSHACNPASNDCAVEVGTATVGITDNHHHQQVKDKMLTSAIETLSEAENGNGIPTGVTVRVIKPTLTFEANERLDTSEKSSLQTTEIIVQQAESPGTALSTTGLTFGCVGALIFGMAVALLQYRRKRSQLGSDDDSTSGVSIWSAKPPALAAGESDDESATTALSHSPVEPTNLPIPGAPASSPIVMVKMYGDGKNTVETTAPDYLPPNVPPSICFELMEEKRATPASCAITIDDSGAHDI